MHHKADVRLVDTHPEGHRRHHDLQIVALEFLLHVGANGVFQTSMVSRRADAAALQTRGGIFHFRAAVAVDDARFAALILNVAHQLVERFEFLHQHIADVRPVEAADLNQRIVKPEQTDDITAGGVIGGGGQRHKRDLRHPLAQLAQRGIFRTEVMAPLGDTVRFVYRQHRQVPVRQMLKKVIQHQPFRRDIQQTNLPAAAAGHHLLLLLAALRRVQTSRRHAVGQQLIDLVFHQRDQG